MAKSVTFTPNPRSKPDPESLDAFVQGRPTPPPAASETRAELVTPTSAGAKVPMKRLTFDIAADLHKRIRLACVEKGIDMAEDLRRILEEHYPPKP